MRALSRKTAAVVGGLVLLCLPAVAAGQSPSLVRPAAHIASIAAGSIQGNVQDERGAPVPGAMVSAFGATTAFAVSDRSGKFELRSLSPGPYWSGPISWVGPHAGVRLPRAPGPPPDRPRHAAPGPSPLRIPFWRPALASRSPTRPRPKRRAPREPRAFQRRPKRPAARRPTITASSCGDCVTRGAPC